MAIAPERWIRGGGAFPKADATVAQAQEPRENRLRLPGW